MTVTPILSGIIQHSCYYVTDSEGQEVGQGTMEMAFSALGVWEDLNGWMSPEGLFVHVSGTVCRTGSGGAVDMRTCLGSLWGGGLG